MGVPGAFEGLDGWFYVQADLSINLCRPPESLNATLGRWLELVSAIRRSGRRVIWLIVPEKSTIYPEYLGSRGVDRDCALHNKARLWSRIEGLRDPDVVGLRAPLLATKRSERELTYLKVGSHWNDLSVLRAVREVMARVGQGVRLRPRELRRGSKSYLSDISTFRGKQAIGTTPTVTVARAGDDTVRATAIRGTSGAAFAVTEHAGDAARTVGGTTLFLHDSFGVGPQLMLQHYVSRLIDARWVATAPQDVIELTRRADTVVLMTSERLLWTLPSGKLTLAQGGSAVTRPFVESLRRELARHP